MSDRGLLATEFVEAHFDQLNLFQGAGLVDAMNCPDGLVVQLLKWPSLPVVQTLSFDRLKTGANA